MLIAYLRPSQIENFDVELAKGEQKETFLSILADTISNGIDDGGEFTDDIFCAGHLVGVRFAKYFTAQEFATVFLERTSGQNLRRKIDIFCEGLRQHEPDFTKTLIEIIEDKLPPVEATAGNFLTFKIEDWKQLERKAAEENSSVHGLPIRLSVIEMCRAAPKTPEGEKELYLISLALQRAGIWNVEFCNPQELGSSLSAQPETKVIALAQGMEDDAYSREMITSFQKARSSD